ncbi:MAG: hypothetical protein K5839_05670 [Treponemataceae bacterium]|nr:hypothetical protein [Treponemataceae bacterium]
MKNRRILICSILLIFVALFFNSCQVLVEAFNSPVKGFFKEYTETAAIQSETVNSTYLTDASGKRCFPSDADGKITFYLRNPQNYSLNMTYAFTNSSGLSNTSSVSVSQTSDKAVAVLTFPQAFLYANEGGKNISGKINLYEPKSGRTFNSYDVSFTANSAPLGVQNAVIMTTSQGGGNYVICFYMPVTQGTIHESDTKTISVNNFTRYFSSDGSSFYTDKALSSEDTSSFLSSYTESLYAIPDKPEFDATKDISGFVPCYYMTGVAYSEDESKFTLKITDDAGLSTSAYISNKAHKLAQVQIYNGSNLFDGGTIGADEDLGKAILTLKHSNLDIEGNSLSTDIKAFYQILQDGSLVESGVKSLPAQIYVPSGTGYSIKAYASADYCIDSDITCTSQEVKVSRSGNYYVSSSGNNDEGSGSKSSPYRTIDKCLEIMQDQITNFGVLNEGYNIYLLSDLSPASSDTFDSDHNYSLIV